MGKLEVIRSVRVQRVATNDKILEAAAKVSEEERSRKSGLSPKGVTDTLAHALGTQIFWLGEWKEPGSFSQSWFQCLDSFEGVREGFGKSHRALAQYLAGLSDADLERLITPPEWWGDTPGVRFPLWHIMLQVIEHSQQHRSEVAQAISAAGASPGELDYVDFAIEEHGAQWMAGQR
jgi:uncharacterized damage-inducible protein DinB